VHTMVEVDSRGRPCPIPVIDLAKAIARVDIGHDVIVLSDDPGAAADIPAWCRMRRQDLVSAVEAGGHTTYRVRRRT
jgi:TusA-related sulfurtransferase